MPRLPLAPALFSTTTCWPNTLRQMLRRPAGPRRRSSRPPRTARSPGSDGSAIAGLRVVSEAPNKAASATRNANDRHCCSPLPLNKTAPNSRSGALRNIPDVEQPFRRRPHSASSRRARSGPSRTTRARSPSRRRRRSMPCAAGPRTGARGDSFNSRPRPCTGRLGPHRHLASRRCGCRPHASCPRSRSARPWRAAAPPRPAPARLRSSPPACCRSGKAAPATAPRRAARVPSASEISAGGTRSS